jgi:hypothetical protein
METIVGISDQTRIAILITNLIASVIILLILVLPWFLMIRKNWTWIQGALKGEDGFIDIHELRIALGYLALVCFIIIFFYLIITSGALGWKYPELIYAYTFLGSVGAEATIIAGMIEKVKSKKTP